MALSRATFRHDRHKKWRIQLELCRPETARQSVINFNLSVWTFIMTLDEMFHISDLRFNYKQIATASVAVTARRPGQASIPTHSVCYKYEATPHNDFNE